MAVCPCGFVFRGVRGAPEGARMGRVAYWRIRGLLWVRRRWSEGLDAALEKYQSGDDHNGPPTPRASQDLPLHALGTLGRV